MKKFYSFLIVLAAAAMVSCAGNTTKTADAAEGEAVEACEECTKECCKEAEGECTKECCKEEKAEKTCEACEKAAEEVKAE